MKPATESALADALEMTAWSLFQLSNLIEDVQVRQDLVKETIGPAFKQLRDVAQLLKDEEEARAERQVARVMKILESRKEGSPPHEKSTTDPSQKP